MQDLIAGVLFLIGVLLVISAILFVPMLAVWAINTIFGTAIVTTVKVWFAVWLLLLLVNLN